MARKKAEEQDGKPANAEPSHWTTAESLAARDVRWILPGRLIAGCLAVLEGETSTGKSTWIAALIAAITTGSPWYGRPRSAPRNVLYLASEEDYASMIRPRLIAAGADESRVITPSLDDAGEQRRVYLTTGLGQLKDAIAKYSLELIVCEPLSSHVGPAVDLCQVNQVRACLDPVNTLGLRTGCTILVTRGLRKDRTGPRMSHGQGSLAISDTARCVLVVERPDQTTTRRVVRVVKCSLAGGMTPGMEHYLDGLAGEPPVVSRMRELDRSQDDDAADVADAGDRDMRDDARHLVRSLCSTEWVRVTVIAEAARYAAIGEKTLRRAKADLRVRTRQLSDGAGNYHEWGPPEGGFDPTPPPPAPPVHVGLPGSKPRKKRGKKT